MQLLIVLFCFMLTVSVTGAVDKVNTAKVLVLTDANFKSEIAKFPVVMVKFYSPGVGTDHPEIYEGNADTLASDDNTLISSVRLAKMDVTDEPKTVELFKSIKIFPSFKIFRFGEYSCDYSINDEPVIHFMKRMGLAVVNSKITTIEDVQKITELKINTNNTAVVGYFPNSNSIDYKIFSEVANLVSSLGISTYHTTNQDVLSKFGFFSKRGTIMMYRPYMKPFKIVYRGTIFKIKLKEWIMKNIIPNFGGTYTRANKLIFQMSGNSYVLFVGTKDDVPVSLMKDLYEKFPNVTFAYADKDDLENPDNCNDTSATVCIIATVGKNAPKSKKNTAFSISGNFSIERITSFVTNFVNGDLKVEPKTQTTTDPVGAGKVTTLVGSNFKSVVAGDKAVFIKFYAPWCGHCKTLAPKLEELALQLASVYDDVVIAKYDATANTLPEEYISIYNITGYPTLFYSPYGKSDRPIIYHGAREVGDMKTWIEEKLLSI